MEASAAGLAAAPASGGAAAQQAAASSDGAENAQEQAQQPDIAAALDRLGTQMEDQRQFLESKPWEQPAADAAEQQQEPKDGADAEEQQIDLSFLDETRPGYDPQAAMQQLVSTIDGIAERRANAAVERVQGDVQELRTNAAIDALVAKYPQMGEVEVGKTVIDTAQEWAKTVGKPELGTMPEFYELVYLAGRAADAAQQEDSASADGAATLTGAGGASPGGAGQGAAPTTDSVTQGWGGDRLPLFTGGRR